MKNKKVSRKGFLGLSASALTGFSMMPYKSLAGSGQHKSDHKWADTDTPIHADAAGTDGPLPESFRIGLAQLRRGNDIPESVRKIEATLAECGRKEVDLVCFPETYLPGLRGGMA